MERREEELTLKIGKIKRKASLGDVSAQHFLASSYAVGDGVGEDKKMARYWYQQAAKQGDATAAFNLAAMVLSGEGGNKSKRMAQAWFRKASALGSSDASVYLGEVALSQSDFASAYGYFADAILQGDARGLRGISILLQDSTDERVAKGASQLRKRLKRFGVHL